MATIEAKVNEDFVVVSTNSWVTDGTVVPEYFTKSGWLSGQALALGYVERAEGFWLSLEGGVLHVKGNGVWESFDSLNEARKYFVAQVKESLRGYLRGQALAVA